MTFHWPLLLWLLAIPALWLVCDLVRLRRQKSTTAATPSKILRAEATRNALRLQPFSPSALQPSSKPRWRFCLGLACAIVALARPQWGRLDEPVFDQSREILIALDLSKSMTAPDVTPSRLDRAKLLITSLLERLEGERVGLAVFSGTAFLQSPLSADYEILRDFLPSLDPDFLPQGGSNYREMLQTALDAFSDGVADRYLIVLSDGEATDEDWKPLADELKKKSIRVLGLGIGTPGGAMIPDGSGGFVKDDRGAVVLSRLEPRTLQQLAETTTGRYTDASSWVDLAQLIESTVETGRKGAFLERNRIRLAERFQWALAPALLLFAWSFWREFPVRPRPRDLALKTAMPPPSAGGATPPSRTTVASLLITTLTLLSPFTLHLSLFAADAPSAADPTATIAQPLSTLVGHFSTRDTLAARDYAELARTTLTYGERLQSAKHPVPEGPIHDALLAVDRGEAADAKAADWPDLRAKLKKLLEKPAPPPEQDQQKQDQKNEDEKQDQKDKEDSQNQSGQSGEKNADPQKSEPEKSQDPKDQPQPQDSQPENKNPENSPPQDNSQGQPGDEQKKPPQDPESAFGDMTPPEQPPPQENQPAPPPPSPGENQKIGGASEKQTAPVNPELTIPLQKLDQVRNLDSPGRLFQLMQDPKDRPEKTGKDW